MTALHLKSILTKKGYEGCDEVYDILSLIATEQNNTILLNALILLKNSIKSVRYNKINHTLSNREIEVDENAIFNRMLLIIDEFEKHNLLDTTPLEPSLVKKLISANINDAKKLTIIIPISIVLYITFDFWVTFLIAIFSGVLFFIYINYEDNQ